MLIEKSRVVRLERYLDALPPNSTFKVIATMDGVGRRTPQRAGFESDSQDGDTLLPSVVGKVTRFNAEGRWRIRRDLPKERRYIYSRSWRHIEWHGRDPIEVDHIVDYYRDCYPREWIEAPSIEVTCLVRNGSVLVASPALTHDQQHADHNLHVVNLFLELFGECEVVLENLARLTPPATRRVNWAMLPPGEHPWNRIERHIARVTGGRSPSIAKAILERQHVIVDHRPSSIFRGEAGFSDYLAYVFLDRGFVILESVKFGNALYVLGEDWELVSRLTKAEVIQGKLALHRIIHSEGWIAALAGVFRRKDAA